MIAITGPLIGTDYETEHGLIDTNKIYFVIDGMAIPLTEDAKEDDIEEEL